MQPVLIVGNASEDPFAIDVAHLFGQPRDMSDTISLKSYANGEFCPRFISDETDLSHIGDKLRDHVVVIVSTSNLRHSRQQLAMRNLLIARAAKDNGATRVVLVEPDLFYSAQDRGPRPEHGHTVQPREVRDFKKFDGQPFSALLYAQLLQTAGVDGVITVHNHSNSVQDAYRQIFGGHFHNLLPFEVYADYLRHSDMVRFGPRGEGLVFCAPDKGATHFVEEMCRVFNLPEVGLVCLSKERSDERQVEITVHPESPLSLNDLKDRDIIVMDDMVRTGSTIVKACQILRLGSPRRVVFAVSHFYSSDEGRENMATQAIDEILTLNTLPTILNRDVQGRLRKKMVVLKIERWIARFLLETLGRDSARLPGPAYRIDMSSKNPRWSPPPE